MSCKLPSGKLSDFVVTLAARPLKDNVERLSSMIQRSLLRIDYDNNCVVETSFFLRRFAELHTPHRNGHLVSYLLVTHEAIWSAILNV